MQNVNLQKMNLRSYAFKRNVLGIGKTLQQETTNNRTTSVEIMWVTTLFGIIQREISHTRNEAYHALY